MKDSEAWDRFWEWAQDARMGGAEGCVPIALITLPAVKADDGGIDIDLDGEARIVWPAAMSMEDRTALVARIARTYTRGTVREAR